MNIVEINHALAAILFGLVVVFIALYTFHANWWKNRAGRNAAISYMSIAVYVMSTRLDYFPSVSLPTAIIRTVSLIVFIWAVIDRITLLEIVNSKNHRRHDQD